MRAVQRPDGKLVAACYFSDEASGPERQISSTIWTPPGVYGTAIANGKLSR